MFDLSLSKGSRPSWSLLRFGERCVNSVFLPNLVTAAAKRALCRRARFLLSTVGKLLSFIVKSLLTSVSRLDLHFP